MSMLMATAITNGKQKREHKPSHNFSVGSREVACEFRETSFPEFKASHISCLGDAELSTAGGTSVRARMLRPETYLEHLFKAIESEDVAARKHPRPKSFTSIFWIHGGQ
jgi:hypothetical protein